jgi:hypothetical protein
MGKSTKAKAVLGVDGSASSARFGAALALGWLRRVHAQGHTDEKNFCSKKISTQERDGSKADELDD